jgi:hypothetical protein
VVLSLLFFAGCGGNSVNPTGPKEAQLSSATSSVCVTASNKAQTVSVPPAGGVGVTLAFAEYDAGGTGCQDVTVETGAAVSVSTNSKFVHATASTRTVANATIASSTTAPAPIMSISLGAAEPQNTSSLLRLTTIVGGVTITTGNNVFPDGTYLATCTYYILGTPVTNSIVFTASNGTLTITSGEVPFTANSNVQILIYNRGVVPPGFTSVVPTATPSGAPTTSPSPAASATASSTATPLATATPTATPSPSATSSGVSIPSGTVIGQNTLTVSGYDLQPDFNGKVYTSNIVYTTFGDDFDSLAYGGTQLFSGVATYSLPGLAGIVKSYSVAGCTGQVTYGGSGLSGTFTWPTDNPNVPLTLADSCIVNLFTADAQTVNASLGTGSEYTYQIFEMTGPVAQPSGTPPPAQPTFVRRIK